MDNNNPYWREESRIYNLEYEIAKTNDPEKRQQLEALLEKERQSLDQKINYNRARMEAEQNNGDSGSFGWWLLGFFIPAVGLILWIVWHREKPNNAHASIWGAFTSIVTATALVIIAFFVGLKITDMSFDAMENNNLSPTTIVSSQAEPKAEQISNSSTMDQNETSDSTNNSIDTKHLTNDQLKEWVSAVVEAGGVTNNFKVDIDTKDGYAYATVTNTDAQVDSMGTYRVNEKGELEEDGFYYEKLGAWIVVSPSYMDVSNIPDINNVQSQQINPISNKSLVTNFDSAVDWLKEHKENWSYSNKNSETVVITGVNESLTDLRNDELGSYYTVVVNTNDDDGGITGSTKQFKVYTNGVIQQRAGMHDFYTIYTGS